MDDRHALLEECLRKNGELTLPSTGTSMWPELREGDELKLARVGFEDLQPGDVVVFGHASSLVAHRVLKAYVESGRAMLLVKGDHRAFADPPIFYEQVVGRVEEARREGRTVYRRRGWRDRAAALRSGLQERLAGASATALGLAEPPVETRAAWALAAQALGWGQGPTETADADALYAKAAQGRLTGLLAAAPGLSEGLRERCARDLREEQGRQLLLYGELENLMAAFERAGVPLMVVKGPAIADAWYARSAWRPMVDLDLVVKTEHWPEALALLEAQGFTPETSDWSRLTEAVTGQEALLKQVGPLVVAVELHRDLAILSERQARAHVDMARAWAEARPYRVGSAGALTLGSEDALAYACTHWAQHHCFGSIWLVDIALIGASAALDWQRLERLTEREGTRAHVFAALYLARHMLGAPVPDAAIAALAPEGAKAAAIRHLAWRKATEGFSEKPDARSFALQLLLLPGWRGTLGGLLRGLWPSATWLKQHYGPERKALRLRHMAALWRSLSAR